MAHALLAPDAPLHIVSNASSGPTDADEARERIEAVLAAAGRAHEFILIQDPSQLASVAKRAVDASVSSGGVVVVAGGDGTINAVLQAVLPMRRPFGIIPQGTFNYSSRAHGIPLDIAEATRALLSASIKPVQVGLANERAFLVNASLGLYPELLQDREEYKRQYGRHRTVAMWSGLMTLMREHRQLLVEIEHDSAAKVAPFASDAEKRRERLFSNVVARQRVRTPSIFIGNNALQLEQVGLEEAEAVKRSRLAAVIVQPVAMWELVGLAVRGMLGRLGEDERVRNFAFERMTVRPLSGVGRRGIKIAVDGEVFWCQPPITFRVAPQPLMLLVPAATRQ